MKITIEILGWIATCLVIMAFYLNTRNIIASDSKVFLFMNFASGLLMSINSGYHQAYPSMIANICWLTIALNIVLKRIRI
jgi:uncharacterized protein with PQ loop repeat